MFEMTTPPPDGTILVFGIQFEGSRSGRVYTYPALYAGGRWYFTSTGPDNASWGAVRRWLSDDRKTVVWVKAVSPEAQVQIWPAAGPGTPITSPGS